MISKLKGPGAVVLALAVAVMLITATAGIGVAAECGKKLSSTIAQELVIAGAMQATFCGIAPDGTAVWKSCPSHYWRKPPHKECQSGGEDYCCRNVVKEYEYRSGTCVMPAPGTCTYGALATAPDDEVPLEYVAATLLPCNNGEPHQDCGTF